MQRYWLFPLLAAAFLLLAARADAGEPALAARYAPLAKMDTQARKAWVEDMLHRLDKANRVVLAPAAVAKQHSRFQRMLDAFVEDHADWQRPLAKFDDELALSQRAAIEHLTRRYRLDVYQTFRTDRAAFERRRSLLERLLVEWRNSRSPKTQQHKVVQWLIVATRHSADPNVGRLPPLPDFQDQRQTAPAEHALARSESSKPERTPSALPPERLPVRATVSEVPLLLPSVAQRTVAPLSGPHPAGLLANRIAVSTGWNAVRPAAHRMPAEVELPLAVRQSTPRPHHVAMRPSFEPFGLAAVLKPTTVASSSRATWRRPSSVAGVTRPLSRTPPRIASRSMPASPSRSGDPLAFARTRVDRLTMVSRMGRPRSTPTALTPTRPGGTSSSSRPYPTTLGAPASSEGDSLASLDPGTSPTGNFAGPGPRNRQPGQPNEPSTPNMDELASRIRGNNVALRKLAARLYEGRSWNVESLTAILDQLTPLVTRKDDLKLIRELIPPQRRDRVGTLESGSELISDLGSKIARARSQVKEGRFEGSLAKRKAELEHLDELSRKLAGLVFSD